MWHFSLLGILTCFWQNLWLLPEERSINFHVFAERECRILEGKRCMPWPNQKAVITAADFFIIVKGWLSFTSWLESLTYDYWTDAIVNFKLDFGADCNVTSQLLFDQLPEGHQQDSQYNAKLKVHDRCRITLRSRVRPVCKYKGKNHCWDQKAQDTFAPKTSTNWPTLQNKSEDLKTTSV